ncbi:serine--tRNA ligase-like protein [Tanacetum coccineum]|uniref:Serine--tRNA ligase-like protein n=1 Tax=Tanacetum coccineum TaxID=301880 RepID=A0ABQ4YSV1_9ASTR
MPRSNYVVVSPLVLRRSYHELPKKYKSTHNYDGTRDRFTTVLSVEIAHITSCRSKMVEADINTLTMEQYLALTRRNHAPGCVIPITLNVSAAKEHGRTNYLRINQHLAIQQIILDSLVRMILEKLKAILQNQLPSKEEDPWSFILPCSIGKLTFNALADLGATISIMPLLMFKRLGIGELKPINMTIEMADRTKSTPRGVVENLLVKIDKIIFPIDFVILDMVEDLRMPIILGRPLLATAHAMVDIFRKSISLEVVNQKVVFKTKNNPNKTLIESVCAIRNEKGVTNDDLMKIDHDLKVCKMTKERILNDYWRQELDENLEGMIDMNVDLAQEMNPNTEEDCEDLENFEEENMELILDTVLDKLDGGWFSETVKDEDDLDGIADYLELKSDDGFIDIDDEAYKERMCKMFGMTYKKPSPILIEEVEVTGSYNQEMEVHNRLGP